MIHHLHFIGWKIIALVAWSLSFMTIAVTEAFLGQLVLMLISSLIGAAPATVAIIMLSKKQSEERRIAQQALLKEQQKMAENLDGKLDRLSKAETGQAKAEGIIEGGDKEQARAAIVPTLPTEIKIMNKKSEAVPTIPGIDSELKPNKKK